MGRFTDFTEDERGMIHFALQQSAKRIMDKAATNEYSANDLIDAAGSWHLLSSLASELGVTLGDSAMPAEGLEMAALCIAEGGAPFAASLGAHADVPVSVEEDELIAERDGCGIPCSDECKEDGCQA